MTMCQLVASSIPCPIAGATKGITRNSVMTKDMTLASLRPL